jgi:hypothetical protein
MVHTWAEPSDGATIHATPPAQSQEDTREVLAGSCARIGEKEEYLMCKIHVLIVASALIGVSAGLPRLNAHAVAVPLSEQVAVTPNPMPYDSDVYVSVVTAPGALCTAKVVYGDGTQPHAFLNTYNHHSYVAARNGAIAWFWHQKSKAKGGSAVVTCAHASAHASGVFNFVIKH